MSIDLCSFFNNTSNHVSNKTVIGTIISSPILFAILLIVTLWVILMLLNDDDIKPTFKSAFYVTLTAIVMTLVHDNFIENQLKEKFETKGGSDLVSNITALGGTVQPRSDPEQVRQSFMQTLPSDGDELLAYVAAPDQMVLNTKPL